MSAATEKTQNDTDPIPACADRVRQAARADSGPEAMTRLAHDPDIIVRAALALNGACGSEVDSILASDSDDRVRALLGSRIARLLPTLDAQGQEDAAEHIHYTLGVLARDQATRVRAAIAEEIKFMAEAPRDLVLALAQDEAVEVSAPILRVSPVLTDNDLLALLSTPPFPELADAIASRPKLSAAVADAIVAYAGAPAIRNLLANRSACIQEATLDALVGRAPNHTDWHAPLVHRPHLSTKAVRAMSEFIALDLMRVLAGRHDLDPAKLEIVRKRLADETVKEDEQSIEAEAERLKATGVLDERLIQQIIETGDVPRLMVFLAVAGGVSVRAVKRVVELRSAKALVSLASAAGLSMRVAVSLQTILAQFAPDHVLTADAGGGFPLTPDEMEWQLELMRGNPANPPTPGPTWSGTNG